MLTRGASGDEVRQLQTQLAEAGFSPGAIDGIFGPQTEAALRNFQTATGIDPTGTLDAATAGIFEVGAPQAAPESPALGSVLAIEPEQDPQFLAFQRALGVEESELRNSIQRRRAATQRRLAIELPSLDRQLQLGIEQIGDRFAARGIPKAGERALEESRLQGDVGGQRAQLISDAAEQQANLDAELAQKLAEQQRKLAEASLETRQNLATSAATEIRQR